MNNARLDARMADPPGCTNGAVGRVVFGVIGDDIHAVANRLMEIGLRDFGFQAFNLGVRNRPQEFVSAAMEVSAHAVLVSSLNGEAQHWCRGIRHRFIAAGMKDIVLYAGGNLMVGEQREETVAKIFTAYGFDKVFYGTVNFTDVFEHLREDIGHRST